MFSWAVSDKPRALKSCQKFLTFYLTICAGISGRHEFFYIPKSNSVSFMKLFVLLRMRVVIENLILQNEIIEKVIVSVVRKTLVVHGITPMIMIPTYL